MVRRSVFLGIGACALYLFWLPNVQALRYHNPTTTSLIQRRQAQARKAGRTRKPQMIWRNVSQISPYLTHAVLLAEDDTFYRHSGLDFQQIQAAVQRNWEKKRFVYGGSTITQQLARTLYLSPRKNLLRKLKEAILAIYLEAALSKRRILELYLNVAEWGPGLYGAEAASRHYFGKTAIELTPDEAVALASILPSPRRWSPLSEKAFMARRRTQLMERMRKAGYND